MGVQEEVGFALPPYKQEPCRDKIHTQALLAPNLLMELPTSPTVSFSGFLGGLGAPKGHISIWFL